MATKAGFSSTAFDDENMRIGKKRSCDSKRALLRIVGKQTIDIRGRRAKQVSVVMRRRFFCDQQIMQLTPGGAISSCSHDGVAAAIFHSSWPPANLAQINAIVVRQDTAPIRRGRTGRSPTRCRGDPGACESRTFVDVDIRVAKHDLTKIGIAVNREGDAPGRRCKCR